MARLYLVRHGEPTGSWGTSPDPDPGLSELGHKQAQGAADSLRLLNPKHIFSSPLRRAQETSIPLCQLLQVPAKTALPVAEIPTPKNVAMDRRGEWLRAVMGGSWGELDRDLQAWRTQGLEFLLSQTEDAAVFSHYVFINSVVGAAIGDDRVHCFAPSHASITIVEVKGRAISLVELGAAGTSAIR